MRELWHQGPEQQRTPDLPHLVCGKRRDNDQEILFAILCVRRNLSRMACPTEKIVFYSSEAL